MVCYCRSFEMQCQWRTVTAVVTNWKLFFIAKVGLDVPPNKYSLLITHTLRFLTHRLLRLPTLVLNGTSGGSRINFCVWGANGAGIFVWGAKWGLSAEGAKLRLPKARSLSRLGDLGERRNLPQRGLGRSPRNQRDFEHFNPKWSTFWDPVNLTFLNN